MSTRRGRRRLKPATDAKGQERLYAYKLDNALALLDYENEQIATAGTVYAYDAYYPRVSTIRQAGADVTAYAYNPVPLTPTFGAGQLESVDGPLPNDTMTFAYDVEP